MEVASDGAFGLDHGLAAENDVLRAQDVGPPGHFVACFLCIVVVVLAWGSPVWWGLSGSKARGDWVAGTAHGFNVFASRLFGRHCTVEATWRIQQLASSKFGLHTFPASPSLR